MYTNRWKNSTKTRTYYAWRSMRSRCLNPLNPSWKHYGARGITVCDEWLNDFDAFHDFMGEAPDGKSLERINVNGNYEPNNCKWATMKEQANNKTSNKFVEFNGKVMTLSQWADYLEIGKDTLHRRINIYKMDLNKALTKGNIVREVKHGTRTSYENHKCKCDLCKKSNTERHRIRRQNKKKGLKNE